MRRTAALTLSGCILTAFLAACMGEDPHSSTVTAALPEATCVEIAGLDDAGLHLTLPAGFSSGGIPRPEETNPKYRLGFWARPAGPESVGVYQLPADDDVDLQELRTLLIRFMSDHGDLYVPDDEFRPVPGDGDIALEGSFIFRPEDSPAHPSYQAWLLKVDDARVGVLAQTPTEDATRALADDVGPTIGAGDCP